MRFPSILFALLFPVAAMAGIKAGFVERDITPEVGMEVPGGYGKAFSKKIHDPCKARVAVFDDGKKRVALVGVDALMIRRVDVLAARKLIAERCGIPGENVMIVASHSHSSGPTGMIMKGDFDHADAFVQRLAYELSSNGDLGYVKRMVEAIADGVVAADAAKKECTLSFGSGEEKTVAFNRRQRMKNGLSYSHARQGNPDIVDYAGPIDPQVGVIAAWDPDGALMGCVVNFSCHATTSGPWVSANWPYYTERVIQGYYGKGAPMVFLQAPCGDVTQVDNLSKNQDFGGDAWAQFVGGRVGAEALKVMLGMVQTRTAEVPLDARAKLLTIPRRKPSPERVRAARELAAKTEKEGGPDWVWAKETVLLDALLAKEPRVETEVQAIQVGPVVCLSTEAEYFVQYALELKAGSGFPLTFAAELANGCVGYVPTLEAFSEHGGGYETRLTSYSNLEITAGDRFRDELLALAREMKPATLPQRPPSPAFKAPWSYGNVAPQRE
jgi:neutral ceramidase